MKKTTFLSFLLITGCALGKWVIAMQDNPHQNLNLVYFHNGSEIQQQIIENVAEALIDIYAHNQQGLIHDVCTLFGHYAQQVVETIRQRVVFVHNHDNHFARIRIGQNDNAVEYFINPGARHMVRHGLQEPGNVRITANLIENNGQETPARHATQDAYLHGGERINIVGGYHQVNIQIPNHNFDLLFNGMNTIIRRRLFPE